MIEMAGQEALSSGFLPSQEDVQAAVSGGEGPTFGGESSCRSERDDVEGSGVHNGAAQSLEELAGILYAAQCGVQRSTAAE
jgi:hypothetical protein